MDELVLDMQEKMNKSIDSLKQQLTSLRTGKATPSMLNGIEVDYYGTMTPINQMSSVSVPEPRQLLIKPYDKNDAKAIIAAINKSYTHVTEEAMKETYMSAHPRAKKK